MLLDQFTQACFSVSPGISVLARSDFETWDELVSKSPHGTIFHHSWWLDATGHQFEIVVFGDNEGRLLAGIPLPRKARAGLRLFHSPMLTPYLGPVFDLSNTKTVYEQVCLMRTAGEALARAINGYDSLIYSIGPGSPDLQGFLWAGFNVQLAYTFRFESNVTMAEISKGLATHHRKKLARARAHQILSRQTDDVETVIELNHENFARQGLRAPYDSELVRRLWTAAHKRDQASIYLSRDARGTATAGMLTFHDNKSAYNLVSAVRRCPEATGALELITWNAISDSVAAARAFDFEGSSIRGVENNFRHWGAVPKPIWRLEKAGTRRGTVARVLWRSWLG